MNAHYSDYLKKSIPVKELTYDKVKPEDKKLLQQAKADYIKANVGFLVILTVGFIGCGYFFINFTILPSDNLLYKILAMLVFGAGTFATGKLIYGIVGGVRGIRRGVVLTANRVQEVKDNRNTSYQYVVDIYMEDKDQTLMSYSIDREVFAMIDPGDGVIIAKIGNKPLVLADPERKAVMDVSTIKSGI